MCHQPWRVTAFTTRMARCTNLNWKHNVPPTHSGWWQELIQCIWKKYMSHKWFYYIWKNFFNYIDPPSTETDGEKKLVNLTQDSKKWTYPWFQADKTSSGHLLWTVEATWLLTWWQWVQWNWLDCENRRATPNTLNADHPRWQVTYTWHVVREGLKREEFDFLIMYLITYHKVDILFLDDYNFLPLK